MSYARGGGFRAASGGINNIIQMLMAKKADEQRQGRIDENLLREQTWRNEDIARADTQRTEDLALRATETAEERAWREEQAELERSGALSRTLASRQAIPGRPLASQLLSQDSALQLLTEDPNWYDRNSGTWLKPLDQVTARSAELMSGRSASVAPTPDPFNWAGGGSFARPPYRGPLRPDAPSGSVPVAPTSAPPSPNRMANIQAASAPVETPVGPIVPPVDASIAEPPDLGRQGRAIMDFLRPAADKMKANLERSASYQRGGPMGPPTPTDLPTARPDTNATPQDPDVQRAIDAVRRSGKSEAEIRSALMDYFQDETKVAQVLRGARGR